MTYYKLLQASLRVQFVSWSSACVETSVTDLSQAGSHIKSLSGTSRSRASANATSCDIPHLNIGGPSSLSTALVRCNARIWVSSVICNVNLVADNRGRRWEKTPYRCVNVNPARFHVRVFSWQFKSRVVRSCLVIVFLQQRAQDGKQSIQRERRRAE